jgi:hypothetical protein
MGAPLSVRARGGAALLAAAILAAPTARAQDDGPRVYQLTPKGAQAWTGFAVVKRGNEEPEVGTVIPGSDIDTDLVILRYVTTLSLGGRQFAPFVILPAGRTKFSINDGVTPPASSSGFGDLQVGGVLGLIGSPALSPADYARFKPGFSAGLFAKVYFPTGAYSAAKPVNLGSNRHAFQIGLPTGFAWGTSYRDPRLTTLEVFPTLTVYADNDDPYGADRSSKDTLFSVEGHLTHNLDPPPWLSADLLYRRGGETTTDGVAAGDATHGWSAGGSVGWVLDPRATLILTYQQVIERDDDGPDGGFFRAALVLPF